MLVHRSSARRKSCSTCSRAKRRCDLGLPKCSRCLTRGAACNYETPPQPTARQPITAQDSVDTTLQVDMLSLQNTLPPGLAINGTEPAIGVSINFDMFPLDSFSFPERQVIRKEQIEFCITQFKGLIPQLVQLKQSPFIHHDSYSVMPPVVYQDLLGISALYCQKSPQNQTLIFSILDSRVSTLIATSGSLTWSIQEYLMGVQALIIYQAIRLFDGDIRQRANAERDMNFLETWTMHLSSTSNIFSNGCEAGSSYERWVFIESVRRTILMSILIQAIYSFAKNGYCTSVPFMATLPLSLDGSLWSASEEIWWQSTCGLGGNLVTYGDFMTQWSGGDPLHTDTFETILIAACKHNLRRPPMMT